ncbi:MAG: putative selenate reductase subunit YgfK [Phaeodactylibacter sp.]|nr:putative selenate reductase subunit YgfK [Phaeodactylibacter sp.]
MPDTFSPISLPRLLQLILHGGHKGRLLYIPEELFFIPRPDGPFRTRRYGQLLDTPLGVAAGPHTQLAQNIIAAWLCGARFIELKTVQTLDELAISKPCIDMQDEGYNCEWSQELRIGESFDEYLHAWILIHALRHQFGWEGEPGTIFNMSIGYNLAGILQDNVQEFLDKMADCSAELEEKKQELRALFPQAEEIDIPTRISDNVTLSTMHGCPPEEIEKIGRYLIEKRRLHTTIKLNPTLLGPERVRDILNRQLGYYAEVPDIAFEHDLKYPDALQLIENLRRCARENGVHFGLKLTNTLEVTNHKAVFDPQKEKMMYLSGRALHPLTVLLAQKLQNDFGGALDLSFSGGADCFNFPSLIASGLGPVTVCSDLLKPGGYGRLRQYLDNLSAAFAEAGAGNTESFIRHRAGLKAATVEEAARHNLNEYAGRVLEEKAYRKHPFLEPDIKSDRKLNDFDCIQAPCVEACPAGQDIPGYMHYAAQGEWDKALEVVLDTNPFPNVLGLVCDHLCQPSCTRINYDNPLLIRQVKYFIGEHGEAGLLEPKPPNGRKAAIIGAGPTGLACAYFLAREGFEVNVYEAKERAGGMVSAGIPSFRLRKAAIEKDIARIESLGVKIHYGQKINKAAFEQLRSDNDFLYLATGAQQARQLDIPGAGATGVYNPLEFLFAANEGRPLPVGRRVAVIGGGNTAIDVARTALRLMEPGRKVTMLYRRTKKEMPADPEEVLAVLAEQIEIMELVAPVRVNVEDGQAVSLTCRKMELGEADASGRARPVRIEHSEFELPFDTIIPAIGQDLHLDFIDGALLKANPETGETQMKNVFIGGDASRGAANIVEAVGDGQRVARHIIRAGSMGRLPGRHGVDKAISLTEHLASRARRAFGAPPREQAPEERRNFELVQFPLTEEAAKQEASRCLYCDEVCNVCVSVCPNLAMYSYEVEPFTALAPTLSRKNGQLEVDNKDLIRIEQPYQILNIQDFCNECGNCTTFCPTSGRPFADKPRFCLTQKSFEKAEEGYYIRQEEGRTTLFWKKGKEAASLARESEQYVYRTPAVTARFDRKNLRLLDAQLAADVKEEVSLKKALEMKVLLEGAEGLYAK